MSLVERIRKDMFEASKEGDTFRVDILKLALAEIKNEEIAKGNELNQDAIEQVLRKEQKKIKDSIEQFNLMKRDDLVKKEEIQLDILNTYLPEPLSEEEIEKIVEKKIVELEPQGVKDMGRVMGEVMKELSGKADGNTVKAVVLKHLS